MKSLYIIAALLMLVSACKPPDQKNEATNQIETKESTSVDTMITSSSDSAGMAKTSNTETSTPDIPVMTETVATARTPPPVPAKPKVCAPNFTKLSTIKNHYIFYVTDFLAEEFKCWVLLEEHGVSVCNGSPCVVYYVENASKMVVHPGLPHHMDDETLRTIGVGRFEYNGKYWEIKGASQWKRKDKGYGYYNTDNQLGG